MKLEQSDASRYLAALITDDVTQTAQKTWKKDATSLRNNRKVMICSEYCRYEKL